MTQQEQEFEWESVRGKKKWIHKTSSKRLKANKHKRDDNDVFFVLYLFVCCLKCCSKWETERERERKKKKKIVVWKKSSGFFFVLKDIELYLQAHTLTHAHMLVYSGNVHSQIRNILLQ